MKKFFYLVSATIISVCFVSCASNSEESVCDHSYKDSIVREATCDEKGIIERICEKCEDKIVAYIDCIPHKYENGVCTDCGERETDNSEDGSSDIGADDDSNGAEEQECQHNYQWNIVREASCKEEGIKEYACTKCKKVQGSPQFIQKTEKHNYVNSKCTVCGKEDGRWTDFR